MWPLVQKITVLTIRRLTTLTQINLKRDRTETKLIKKHAPSTELASCDYYFCDETSKCAKIISIIVERHCEVHVPYIHLHWEPRGRMLCVNVLLHESTHSA